MTNLYKRFQKLIPSAPLRSGVVVAFADGQAEIEEDGGGRLLARGDTSVGKRVFFRNNVIEGDAPDLPVELIEI